MYTATGTVYSVCTQYRKAPERRYTSLLLFFILATSDIVFDKSLHKIQIYECENIYCLYQCLLKFFAAFLPILLSFLLNTRFCGYVALWLVTNNDNRYSMLLLELFYWYISVYNRINIIWSIIRENLVFSNATVTLLRWE